MTDTAYEIALPAPTRRRRPRLATRALRIVAPIAAAAALIGLWQLWTRLADVSPLILPAPSSVFEAMADRFHIMLPEAWVTLHTILVGFGIAAGSGLVLAILIVAFRPVELTIYPILVASQVIPKIAIAPVIFIWFGLSETSRIIIVVLLSFFPVVISSVVGLKSVEVNKLHLARSLGAGKVAIFAKLRIPQAMPDVFGGLKLAATRAVGAAIIAEFISTGEGLGRAILLATFEQRPDVALAGVGYLVVIGITFFFLVAAVERLAVPWHVSVRAGSH